MAGQDASRGNPFPRSAIQEYRVITQNFKAEYQKASSAIITSSPPCRVIVKTRLPMTSGVAYPAPISTFHFCVRMQNLSVVGQPKSLAEFTKTYHVREFDGHSDECLKDTKPEH